MNYIGIDLGTSSVKVLLVNKKGKILFSDTEYYSVSTPHLNWSEQDPSLWWEATKKIIRKITSKFNPSLIKGISFGGQMHGLVALDKNNNVIRPCILWNDGRTEKETKYLNEVIGKDVLVKETGNFAFAGFTLPKILWMKENEPNLFKEINMILLPKDYLVFKFTNKFSTDYSDAAGTLLLDVKHKKWSKKMCEIAGISEKTLPILHESYDFVGFINEDVAYELHLDPSTKIFAGAGDNAAAAIGTGCVEAGKCNISLGTSGTIFVPTNNFICDKNVALHSFNHANGLYHLMGCILTAASANGWWIKSILNSKFSKEYDIDENELGLNNVYFAPYLNGERCPYNDVNVRGAFIGLSSQTSKKDMNLSILEGVTFALKDCYELMKNKGAQINAITLCGGGSRIKIWPKIIANVFGLPVIFVKTEQGPAYGAAIIAMVGNSEYKDVKEATDNIVQYTSTILPNNEITNRYSKQYLRYKKLYKMLKDF